MAITLVASIEPWQEPVLEHVINYYMNESLQIVCTTRLVSGEEEKCYFIKTGTVKNKLRILP